MINALQQAIRRVLRENPDGLTVAEIADAIGKRPETVSRSVRRMPDVYIDRWLVDTTRTGPSTKVLVAVPVPEDCPRPVRGGKKK